MSDQYWKTAKEWAEMRLQGLPTTKISMIRLANTEDWQSLGEGFARKRKGRGGGWEYHLGCLPDAAQKEFQQREAQAVQAAAHEVAKAKETAIVAKSASTSALTARQSLIMQSRAIILREIERREIVNGGSRRQTILTLIDEYNADLQLADDLRVLPDNIFNAAKTASGRGDKLSKSQIYDWLKLRKEGGVAALAPKLTRVKQEQPAYLVDFLRYYCKPSKPTIAEALRLMAADAVAGAVVPNYDQVTRALKQLKGTANWLDGYRGRESALALKARMAFTRRSTDDLEPSEVYTSDGTTFDAEVAHPDHHRPFKPEITLTVDVATRKVVGWSAGLAENAQGVADALRRACEHQGIPAIFYTDRGSGYKNAHIGHDAIGIAARLGITVEHALPQNAQARGLMERVHRSILVPFAKTYSSYLGKGMDRHAAQKQYQDSRKDVATFGESKLIPSWAQFLSDLEATIDSYNERPHSQLPKAKDAVTGKMVHQSPNAYWAHFETIGFEAFKVSDEESQDLFRPYVERKVRRCEIQHNTNRYFSTELSAFHEQLVYVGYDMHDGSKVWVREIDRIEGEAAPGRLLAVAAFAGNETRYFPKTATDAAKEGRAKGRLKRIDKKRDDILDELRAPITLTQDQHVDPLAALYESTPTKIHTNVIDLEPVDAVSNDAPRKTEPVATSSNLYFSDDISLARWALEHPSEITGGQIRILKDLVNRKSGRDLLEISDVDLNEIKDLILNAA